MKMVHTSFRFSSIKSSGRFPNSIAHPSQGIHPLQTGGDLLVLREYKYIKVNKIMQAKNTKLGKFSRGSSNNKPKVDVPAIAMTLTYQLSHDQGKGKT